MSANNLPAVVHIIHTTPNREWVLFMLAIALNLRMGETTK